VLPATGAAQVTGRPEDLQGVDRRHRHAQPRGRGQQDVPHAVEEGINIQMITTSEIKTSVVIDEKYMELAVRALHKAFDLDAPGGRRTAPEPAGRSHSSG
jgi:aspartate kinase